MKSSSNHTDDASWVDTTALIPPVRQLLGAGVSSIHHWTIARSVAGGGDELGVWLVEGTAVVAGEEHPWTIFLKGWSAPEGTSSASDWNLPQRETLIYRSGMLAELAGELTAPRFLGDSNRLDGSHWLWLEGTSDDHGGWPVTRYGQVARQLGQMNGAYMTDRALPDHPWLSRGWLGQWVEIAGPAVGDLDQHADHFIVRRALPPPVAVTLGQVWKQRRSLLALLGDLPQTFCHLDAYRRNLLVRKHPDGLDEIVAIDWGFAGIAALGEEIAALVAATLFFGEISPEGAADLEQMVFSRYIAEPVDAGWKGDPDQVRTGYVASVALRYGVGTLRGQMFYFLDARNHPRMERMMGMPMDDIIVLFRTLNGWVADLGEEALRRLDTARTR